MIKLTVKVTLPDNTVLPCGEIIATPPDPRGKVKGAFRYYKEYLKHPLAFPLDPVTLPLSSKEFSVTRSTGVHAVFEDALPDDWGRKLLIQKAKLGRGEQTIPKLLEVLGANGLGALSFFSKENLPDENSWADMVNLNLLTNAAFRYDSGIELKDEELQLLFRAGSSPGGARPKALIQKETGSLWIAKFPSCNDKLDLISIEAATLELAKLSGLIVPRFELHKAGGRNVLLVHRFDISNKGGRHHMISLQTLLQAEGYYFLSYNDVFRAVNAHSCQPSIDIPALFRQMVFNVAIGNTDDHLKNFCMLHKETGFYLSPVYDVLPDIYEKREHSLSFGLNYLPPDRERLKTMANLHNIKNADQIMDEVYQAVSGWQGVFQRYRVPESDIHRLEWGIQKRLKSR